MTKVKGVILKSHLFFGEITISKVLTFMSNLKLN